MEDYMAPIHQVYANAANGNMASNDNFYFEGGRFVPRLHEDDWADVQFEGVAGAMDGRNQVYFAAGRRPTANTEFLLQDSDSHLCTDVMPPTREDGVRGRGVAMSILGDLWASCPLDVSILIRSVSFEVFLDSVVGSPRNKRLIVNSALAQYWWDTTNTFHFRFGEMTMTPLDFHMMTGLAFVGEPIHIDRRRVVTEVGMERALGFVFPLHGENAIRIEDLRRYLQSWAQDDVLTAVQVRQHARCFLLFVLGQALAANGGSVVHLWWLHYFRHFSRIANYNWASVGLVTLYHSMSIFSRRVSMSHIGMSHLWEVWYYMYFDSERRLQPLNNAIAEYPIQHMYRKDNRKKNSLTSVEKILADLRALTANRVTWFPYLLQWGEGHAMMMLSQHRLLLRGEYDFQFYLAERVIRQHVKSYPLRAPADPPRLMRRPDLIPIGEMADLVAGVFFEEFLRGPKVSYEYYATRHLMPGHPPISVKIMQAMVAPSGYAPPAVQPEVLPPPAPEESPEHLAAPDDDDDQQGENIPTGEGDIGGFVFGDAEQPPPPHPRGTPPTVPYAYASGSRPDLLLTKGPSTHQANSSHQPVYGVPSTTVYHLPPIPLIYRYMQGGIVRSREIPRNTEHTEQYFPLPPDLLKQPVVQVYTADIQNAYVAASSWSSYGSAQTEELESLRRNIGGLSLGGTRFKTHTRGQSVRPSECQSVRGASVHKESHGRKRARHDGTETSRRSP